MIKQVINGKSSRTVNARMSTADFTTLGAVLAGENTEGTVQSSGGTPATVPYLNFIKFSTGKATIDNRNVQVTNVPHVKVSKNFNDIMPVVIGVFDQDYLTGTKCDYANLVGASSKGA